MIRTEKEKPWWFFIWKVILNLLIADKDPDEWIELCIYGESEYFNIQHNQNPGLYTFKDILWRKLFEKHSFFINFSYCENFFWNFSGKFLVGLSKLLSTCPEDFFGRKSFMKKFINLRVQVFEFKQKIFRFWVKIFRKDCQNCILRVQGISLG